MRFASGAGLIGGVLDVLLRSELHLTDGECVAHRSALGELHVHLLNQVRASLFRFSGGRRPLRLYREAERAEVAEAHRVPILQRLNNLVLKRVEHGFHVRARHCAALLDALRDLRERNGRGRCHLRVVLHCALDRAFLRLDNLFDHSCTCLLV